MSTGHLRLVAVGLTLIIAVLTGVLLGFVGANEVCTNAKADTAAPVPTENPDGPAQGGRTDPEQPAGQQGTEQRCELSFNPGAASVGFAGVAAGGLAVLAVASAGRREQVRPPSAPPTLPTGSAVPTGPVPSGSVPPVAVDGQARKERATLVETCIYVRDRATSKAIADRLGWALQQVGVAEVAPTGVAFDPAFHEAGGALVTEDPRQAGTVAAVEIPGYTDRGAVLRAPVVTVYQSEGR